MYNEQMHGYGSEPSAIREIFSYANERKAQIGAENVFDFSLGNPSIPTPSAPPSSARSPRFPQPSCTGTRPRRGFPRRAARWRRR